MYCFKCHKPRSVNGIFSQVLPALITETQVHIKPDGYWNPYLRSTQDWGRAKGDQSVQSTMTFVVLRSNAVYYLLYIARFDPHLKNIMIMVD